MVTKEMAMTCTEFFHDYITNRDGAPVRCRANGKCKTWKTRPKEFRLPVKYGLRTCFYITHRNAHEWNVSKQDFIKSLIPVAITEDEDQCPTASILTNNEPVYP